MRMRRPWLRAKMYVNIPNALLIIVSSILLFFNQWMVGDEFLLWLYSLIILFAVLTWKIVHVQERKYYEQFLEQLHPMIMEHIRGRLYSSEISPEEIRNWIKTWWALVGVWENEK